MPRTKLPSAWALLSACFADLLSGRNVSKFAGIRQKSVFRSSLPPWCGAFERTIGQSEFRVKRNFFRLHWDVRSFPPNWSVESLHGAVLALPSLGSEHLNPFRVTNSGWPWWHWWILQILGWQAIKMFVFALTLQMMLSCYPHSRGDSFKSLVNSELSLLVLHLKRTCLVKDDTMRHHWKDGCRVPGARALRDLRGTGTRWRGLTRRVGAPWRLDVIDVTWRFITWRFLPWRLPQGSGGLTVRRGA